MTTIHVKATSGAKITVSVELGVLVSDLKQTLASSDKANVPASQQRLIYRGHVMKDERTLESYGTCAVHGFREPCVCVCVVCYVMARHATHMTRDAVPRKARELPVGRRARPRVRFRSSTHFFRLRSRSQTSR